jgi:hypothetical protein
MSFCRRERDTTTETNVKALVVGVPVALLLAFMGLIVGAELAQFFPPASDGRILTVFQVPVALNIWLGWTLRREGWRSTGQIVLFGGSIASIALPFILL